MTAPCSPGNADPSLPSVGRTGLALREPLPWPECVEMVRAAEDTGYEAVFVPEIAGREAFSTLTEFAGATSRIALGTGVVTMWSRTPVATGMAAATVQDVSGGRLVLGIGAGTPPLPAAYLPASPGGVARLRAYVATVRAVLSGRPVEGDDPFGAGGFQLAFDPGPPPPIWLAALGDPTMALAGEIADGVLLNWCVPERVARARDVVRQAAERAGRDPGSVAVAVYARACLGVDEDISVAALKAMTGQYAAIPSYLRQMEAMGLGTEGAAAARAFLAGRPADVPERLVRSLTVMGGRADALARFAAFHEAGADLVVCYPVAAREPFSSVLGTLLGAAPSPAVEG